MKSKKDEGNQFFKKEKYQQAIECYAEYVKVDHPDNSKAYGNMALSCFRLKKYEECIKACELAVEVQPEFEKAFYRMYEAYKELNDNYGMLIAAERFCKLSKEEKDIKSIQKDLSKIKEDLCYGQRKNSSNSESNKIIFQIVNQLGQYKETQKVKKEPLICLQSKWQKIQLLAKDNKRIALNQARKFINHQCKTQDEKEKYEKLISKLKHIAQQNQNHTNTKQNSQKTDSSEEDPKFEELQKYTAQQEKKNRKESKDQPKPPKVQLTRQKLNHILPQTQNSQKVEQQKAKNQQVKDLQPEGKWEDFIKEDKVQKLYESYINNKMKKHEDQFVGLYECLCTLLNSTQLDRFQKQAILSVTPTKLKKFNMLMKSYTGKEKQQLAQLFAENNLHAVMEKYYMRK